MKSSSGAETVFKYAQPSLTFNAMAKPYLPQLACQHFDYCGFLKLVDDEFYLYLLLYVESPVSTTFTYSILVDQAIQAQDRDLRENFYNNKFQPYVAYWGCLWTGFFILINGYHVFFKFKTSVFIAACEFYFLKCFIVRCSY